MELQLVLISAIYFHLDVIIFLSIIINYCSKFKATISCFYAYFYLSRSTGESLCFSDFFYVSANDSRCILRSVHFGKYEIILRYIVCGRLCFLLYSIPLLKFLYKFKCCSVETSRCLPSNRVMSTPNLISEIYASKPDILMAYVFLYVCMYGIHWRTLAYEFFILYSEFMMTMQRGFFDS